MATNTDRYALGPTLDDVLAAEHAGFVSIDDGHGFLYGFENQMDGLGYRRVDEAPCNCPDKGGHGHLPECRWFRDWPTS